MSRDLQVCTSRHVSTTDHDQHRLPDLGFPFRRVRARDTRGCGASPQERVWKPFLATRIRVEFGPLGNPSIVTVIWPSLRHGRPASTVQQRRERDRLAVRDGQHALKSDPGPRAKRTTGLLHCWWPCSSSCWCYCSLDRSDNQHQCPSRHCDAMSVRRGHGDGFAGRRSLALIHRYRPSAPRTRPKAAPSHSTLAGVLATLAIAVLALLSSSGGRTGSDLASNGKGSWPHHGLLRCEHRGGRSDDQ